MARKLPPTQLSKLIGGVHSQEAEARGDIRLSPDRCVSALNVEEKDGYLKRRPAFKNIAHGPQFIFPAGQVAVSTSTAGTVDEYDRTITVAGSDFTAGTYIYVGCDNPFDGIEIPNLSITTTGFTTHGYLKVELQNSAQGWVELYGVVDFTRGRCVDGSDNIFIHTLTQSGTIAWSPSTVTWDATFINSISKYWVRLSITDGADTAINFGSTATLTIAQPGIFCFELEPVNSIIPARYRNGKSVLFLGGDRQSLRAAEMGCNISAWTQLNKSPKIGFKVDDWGAAQWNDRVDPSEWRKANAIATITPLKRTWPYPNAATSTLYWLKSDSAAASQAKSLDRLIKIDQTYEWLSQQDAAAAIPHSEFRGGCLRYGINPSSVTSNSSTTRRCIMVFSAADLNVQANELEHCFIRITDVNGLSINVGEEVQIVSNTTTTITTYPEFSDAPDAGCLFNIYRPHSRVQFAESDSNDYIWYNFPHYLQFNPNSTTWPFNFPYQDDGWYHFYLGRELIWAQERGQFWNSVYDPVSAKHILTNGKGPLLEWDGKYFKDLAALTDPNSAKVQLYTTTLGAFDDIAEANQETDRFVKGALHAVPPRGKFIVSFGQKIVLADDRTVYWTVAYDTDIWPRRFEQTLSDPFSNSITGLMVLGNQLVAFTPTAIFATPYADQAGMLNFQIVSTGIGFSSGRAVAPIYINGVPSLIGPTADGVRVYSPGSSNPVPVIDSWTQVLPEGVNLGLLSKCVGAASKADLRYYLAVPRAGNTVLDTVLVFDLVTKAWWVWRYPGAGIASISRDYDETGKERILFGGIDGLITILSEQDYDDGGGEDPREVSWNALSPPIEFRGNTIAPVAILLRGDESVSSMTLTTYINGRITEDDTAVITLDEGSVQYGAAVPGTSQYSPAGDVYTKVNLASGTRCTSFQYKLSGTGRFTFKGAELLSTLKGQRGKQ